MPAVGCGHFLLIENCLGVKSAYLKFCCCLQGNILGLNQKLAGCGVTLLVKYKCPLG